VPFWECINSEKELHGYNTIIGKKKTVRGKGREKNKNLGILLEKNSVSPGDREPQVRSQGGRIEKKRSLLAAAGIRRKGRGDFGCHGQSIAESATEAFATGGRGGPSFMINSGKEKGVAAE